MKHTNKVSNKCKQKNQNNKPLAPDAAYSYLRLHVAGL